ALQLTDAARPVLRGDVPLKLAVPRIVALKPRVMQKSFGGNYDKFKVTFGFNVTEKNKPNGKKFNFEYCGFSTFITPVDGVDEI
ncbi:hypothetical protein MJM28_31165, partial [Salmonella enterica subsp. enterica serovar Montevideo]|nr:hypothetical protein [Salmonella enterica subsp. enterica serovar Montevideo]